jgi:predicted TIM-barrel fold metal-dependent hydrolase
MLITGTLHRYSKIKWILAHAGGVLPYLAWRLSLMSAFPEKLVNMPLGVMHYLKKLYYDTALSTSPYAMNGLVSMSPASHILFGSDWPFCTTPGAILQASALLNLDALSGSLLEEVERHNALALFPQFE